jgi:hypothetical protein
VIGVIGAYFWPIAATPAAGYLFYRGRAARDEH